MRSILFRILGLGALAAAAACSGAFSLLPEPRPACQAEQWAVIPTEIFILPGPVGLKIVYVPLALENNSRYWGQVNTSAGDPVRQSYVTGEGGKQYPATDHVQVETAIQDVAQMNNLRSIRSQLYTHGVSYIPPGFALRGETMIGFDHVENEYGAPNTWSQAVYQVEENQSQHTITIPSLTISCIHPDGQHFTETTGPILLELEEDMRQPAYPTSRPDSEFNRLIQPISLPDQGLLELQGMEYQAGMVGTRYLVLDFRLDRTGSGSSEALDFDPVLIGDDGLSRRLTQVYGPPACREADGLAPGPGERGELRLCYMVGEQAGNFKLLWVDEAQGVFQVYSLPEAGKEAACCP